MSSTRHAVISIAMLPMFVSPNVWADELMARELDTMRDMVMDLQDRLDTQQAQLDAYAANQTMAAEPSIWDSIDFFGWISATYNQDLLNPRESDGVVVGDFPFGDHRPNTFSLNQFWLGLDKTPTAESPAGFHVDMTYGAASGDLETDDLEIYAAYASYLLPIGNGVQIDFGELWTLLGGEVVQTLDNYNITRGAVWSLQPVNHVGVIASTDLGNGLGMALGFVNDPFSDENFDTDNDKAVTGQISWSGEGVSAGLSGIYGSSILDDENDAGQLDGDDKYGMIDVLLGFEPSERLSGWINYDYQWWKKTPEALGPGGPDQSVNALAVAGRIGVTPRTGLALRGEILLYDFDSDAIDNEQAYSITGTIDHTLFDGLVGRAEIRYDGFTGNDSFSDGTTDGRRDDQLLGVFEMVYAF